MRSTNNLNNLSKGGKMRKIINSFNSFLKEDPNNPFIVIVIFFSIILDVSLLFGHEWPQELKAPDPITIDIDKPNTKIEYFTYSGVKEKELTKNSVTVKFDDDNSFKIHSGFKVFKVFNRVPLSDAPVIISNGIKNYANIYAQDNLDFRSSKYEFLPIEFYKTFKSSWKDTNNKAVFVYAAPGKPIACFEGSHVNVNATPSKKVKEIHVDGHKAIILNSKYSIYKVGQLKDMYTRKIKIQKREAANK